MAYGCTATITNGSIPSPQSNFVFLLTADNFPTSAVDGGATSILNGGGNLRCYTDDTKAVRLPIEVVEFVTGVTPSVVVWGLLSSASDLDTVYIEADDIEISQPPVTDTYGRNSVWVDFEAVIHANEVGTNGVYVDSTGNNRGTTLTTGASLATTTLDNPFGLSWPDFTTAEALTLASSGDMLNASPMCMSAWVKTDTVNGNTGLFGNRYSTGPSGDSQWYTQQAFARSIVKSISAEDLVNVSGYTTNLQHVYTTHDSSSLDLYINSNLIGTDTSINNPSGMTSPAANNYRIGTYYDNSVTRRYDGRICEIRFCRSKSSQDSVASEYNNQSNPAAFWSTSAWEQQAGTISVEGSTTSLDYNSIDGSVTLSAPIEVAGATTLFNYNAVNANIDLIPTLEVTGSTTSYSYNAIAGDIDLTTEIKVSGATVSYDFDAISGLVELIGPIEVVGLTTDYSYNAINADIALQGEIPVAGKITNYNYSALNGTITLIPEVVIIENPRNKISARKQNTYITVAKTKNTIKVN